MSKSILHAKRIEAFQLVSIPAGVIAIISLLLLLAKGSPLSYSVLMGGVLWLAPNLYFAIKVFSMNGTRVTPPQLLKNFYQAEVTKLVLCGVLFVVMMRFLTVAVLPLLAGFVIAQLSFWLAPFLLNTVRRLVR